jgi:predicted Na+-dependent transporter
VAELPPLLLKLSLVVFMAGNLLEMGLRLQRGATLRGFRNLRFVAWTLVWGFVLGPALRPVRALTAVATLATFVMLLVIYGKDLLGVPGSLALAAQLLFFSIVAGCSFQFAFGLDHAQRVVLSAGMATRNLGAAVAPLRSIAEIDQRAIVMVVL